MRYWDTLTTFEDREGFEIVVDKTWEDIPLSHSFDDSCHDIAELERRVDSGDLDWFMLRVRALIDGNELGSAYLGGCLYEDAREVLEDGTAEDLIEQAISEAKAAVYPLLRKLLAINEGIERAGL
jgi:hypothetical protein